MTTRNRKTLKKFFQDGQLPTEDHFADLIDSMLNMSDEGFRKTVENGNEITAPNGHEALISFFNDQNVQSPAWSISLSNSTRNLLFKSGSAQRTGVSSKEAAADQQLVPLLCLDGKAGVGVGLDAPRATLDVAGDLRCEGRRGSFQPKKPLALKADGEWNDLTDPLEGCQAFEVMAGIGRRGSERFGLVHAIAINTYNPTLGIFNFLNRRRRIRATHAYYSRRSDRLELRWFGTSGKNAQYRLQIRTGCDYGKENGKSFIIQAHVTQLWFDPHMVEAHP